MRAADGRSAQIAAIAEGRAEWVKPTLRAVRSGRRPTARGAKAAVARDVASIQTSALNAMIRHRLDPESLGIARWQTGWLSPRHKLNSTVTSQAAQQPANVALREVPHDRNGA